MAEFIRKVKLFMTNWQKKIGSLEEKLMKKKLTLGIKDEILKGCSP